MEASSTHSKPAATHREGEFGTKNSAKDDSTNKKIWLTPTESRMPGIIRQITNDWLNN